MRLHRISTAARTLNTLSSSLSWKALGKPQQTLSSEIKLSGFGLHSGVAVTALLSPAMAGDGRYFVLGKKVIPARIDFAVNSVLCTILANDGKKVMMVEHVLSALEGCGVDNCCIEILDGDEVPILDGSAKLWVEAIKQVGVCDAKDSNDATIEKKAPALHGTKFLCINDSFIIAFPSSEIRIAYGINFPQAPAIGRQWFSCFMDNVTFSKQLASARTFCIYEEIEKMRKAGLIKGGSVENALICSAASGWLNPPLRFNNEPCRHKILDLIGDFSLLAHNGNQGLPVADIIAYKAGHSLHTEFVHKVSLNSGWSFFAY